MAASGYTPIQLYYSTSAGNVPVNTNLLDGELAINTADGKLFYKDGSTVKTIASGAWSGTVTTVSVVSTNGFAGTVANATTTPAITISTSITGILKGNGTAISAATAGTDYSAGTSALATGILKSTTTTGALSIASAGTDYAPATSGTSILKGNGSGGFSNAAAGTDYAPATSGTSILYGNGSGGFSSVTVGTGLSFVGGTLSNSSTMTYPGAGIAVSTGSAWTTSLTAPSGTIVGTTDTQTLTNKRITPRVTSITGAAGGTITPASDTSDQYNITALGATCSFAAPSGSPTDAQKLSIRIYSAAAQTISSWASGANGYRAIGVTLPTTTGVGKTIYVGCVWNAADTIWDVVAVATQA